MTDLRFDFEWQDPAGARGTALRATWASLSIRVGDAPITELQDLKTRSVRTGVFLPLYPLAEWLTCNWWFLIAEAARPQTADSPAFDHRHNIRWAREGFALPSLRFVPVGEGVEAQWQPLNMPDAGIRFLRGGNAVLPLNSFGDVLREFVEAVVARLDDEGLTATSLHDEWFAIQAVDADERQFCLAAARLGVDPFSADAGVQAAIIDAAKKIRPELLEDFMSLATVERLDRESAAMATATESISADSDTTDALAGVRERAPTLSPSTSANPWEAGYEYAEKLRARLNGGPWKSRSLDELAGHLNLDQLDHCILPNTDACQFLDALTGVNQRKNPKFIIEKRRPDSRQFAFCRALFEHLTQPLGVFAAVSGLRTNQQKMNRAFAAEFLAPHKQLEKDLSGSTIGEDEVAELSEAYGVSGFAIQHQIENHHLAHVVQG